MNNNLKVQGSFQIKFVKEDGTVRDTVEKLNNITEYFWRSNDRSIGSFGLNFTDNGLGTPNFNTSTVHICISQIGEDYEKELFYLHNIYATGNSNVVLGAKVQTVLATSENLIGYVEIRERIDFTDLIYGPGNGYSRTFNCVGITVGSTVSADNTRIGSTLNYTYPISAVYHPCLAYTMLTPECTQLPNEFLDIVYKLQVSGTDHLVINSYLSTLSGSQNTNYLNRNSLTLTNVSPKEEKGYIRYANAYLSNVNQNIVSLTSASVGRLREAKKLNHVPSVPINTLRGRILRSVLLGDIRTSNFYHLTGNTINFSSNKFQPIYSHNSQANTPYYDVNTLASGSIKPTLSGNWNKDIPEMYKIKVDTPGALGVATYKYAVRKFLGTDNATSWNKLDSFTPFLHRRGAPLPLLHENYHFKISGTSEGHCQRIKYSDTQIIQGSSTGILLVDIFNGDYTTWEDLETNNITQFCLSNTDIYVACRNTGLWKINTLTNVVTNISATPCFGVDFTSEKGVAIFNDSGVLKLSTNEDNFATYRVDFTFPLTNLLSSDLNNFLFIKIDQNLSATTYRIAISTINAANTHRVYWWDSVNGVVVGGPSNNHVGFVSGGLTSRAANPSNLISTPQGAWVGSGGDRSLVWYIFGSATGSTSSRGDVLGCTPLMLEDGNILYRTGVAIPPLLVGGVNTTVNVQTFTASNFTDILQPSIVYMGKGLILTDNVLSIIPENTITSLGATTGASTVGVIFNPYVWDNYSWDSVEEEWVLDNPTWNGTNWVEGTGDGKLTHSTTSPLNTNISVSFTELATAGFKAGDYYTQIVCNGVSLDAMTNPFQFGYYWGLYPDITAEIGSGFSIPATAPYMKLIPKSSYLNAVSRDEGFCCMLGEELNKHSFNIEGYSEPAQLLIDQTQLPQANEILINPSNGNLIFNAVDANKEISPTSFYTYVGGYKKTINHTVSSFAGVSKPVILLRGDTGITLNGSSGVEEWADTSGYGHNAVKLTGVRPTLSSLNSVPTVNFTSSTSFLNLPNIASFCDGWSLVTLIRFNSINNISTFFSSDFITNNILGEFRFQNDPTGRISFRFFNTVLGSPGHRIFSTANNTITANTWNLISITSKRETNYLTNDSIIIRVNGVGRPVSREGINVQNTEDEYIFKYPSDRCTLGGTLITPANSFLGEIGFFAFYKNYLTVPELQLVETEVNSIYSL